MVRLKFHVTQLDICDFSVRSLGADETRSQTNEIAAEKKKLCEEKAGKFYVKKLLEFRLRIKSNLLSVRANISEQRGKGVAYIQIVKRLDDGCVVVKDAIGRISIQNGAQSPPGSQ